MLKIICWRVTFEFLSFLKLLGFRGPDVYYFAYGANLDPQVIKNRGIEVRSATSAILSNFALRFNHDVPFKEIGMASIEKSEGDSVPGVVYAIIMDCNEAHLFFNRYKKGRVVIDNKNCFYYFTGRPKEGLLPSAAYLQKIITGYKKAFPSDSSFITQLEKHPSLPLMVFQNPPHFLFTDYKKFGSLIAPWLEIYDRLCVRVYFFLIFKPAIFQRLKKQKN